MSLNDTAEYGLNYVSIPLNILPEAATALEKEIQKDKKDKTIKLNKAEDGNYYLPVGKYQIEVRDGAGKVDITEVSITDPSAKNKSDDLPGAEPDESFTK